MQTTTAPTADQLQSLGDTLVSQIQTATDAVREVGRRVQVATAAHARACDETAAMIRDAIAQVGLDVSAFLGFGDLASMRLADTHAAPGLPEGPCPFETPATFPLPLGVAASNGRFDMPEDEVPEEGPVVEPHCAAPAPVEPIGKPNAADLLAEIMGEPQAPPLIESDSIVDMGHKEGPARDMEVITSADVGSIEDVLASDPADLSKPEKPTRKPRGKRKQS